MSSGEAHVAAFLQALEQRFTPPPGDRHCLFFDAEFGRLALRIAARQPMDSIYLDDGDLAKPVDQLLAEVDQVLHRISEIKRRELEFDHATGG